MNEITIKLSETAMETIKKAAENRSIDPDRMIQVILLEWALQAQYMECFG